VKRSVGAGACVVVLMLTAPMPRLSAQTAPAPQHASLFTISGSVLSASTGQRLDRADVTLSTPPQGNDPQGSQLAETTTAEDGSFRFDQLQPGKYILYASRRGYIAGNYDEHESFSTLIAVGPNIVSGLDVTALRFRLLPEAVIGGTITDEAGDPIRRTGVTLYRQYTSNGLGNIVRAGATNTDDTGAYELAHLQPGTYFVSATAIPWYATRPQAALNAQGNPNPGASAARSPLDVAYPLTFYANATDSENATPIPIRAGDRLVIDLSLHPVPSIDLTFQRSAGGNQAAFPQLTQNIFGSEEPIPAFGIRSMISRGTTQSYEISGIAPGHYDIRFNGPGGESGNAASLDLTGDQNLDLSALSAGVDISGKVAMSDNEKLPRGLAISLRSPGNPDVVSPGTSSALVAENGTFTLHNVSAGAWELVANARGTTLAVTKMEASGAAAEGSQLTVTNQPVSVAALLADGETAVTGFAGRDNKPTPGVMVLLVPRDPRANHELFRRSQSDSDGSFLLRRVVPGNYTLIAVEEGWTLDWARPEVIEKYLARGQAVVVPFRTSDLNLRQPVETQPR
jgi:hypothetical protein